MCLIYQKETRKTRSGINCIKGCSHVILTHIYHGHLIANVQLQFIQFHLPMHIRNCSLCPNWISIHLHDRVQLSYIQRAVSTNGTFERYLWTNAWTKLNETGGKFITIHNEDMTQRKPVMVQLAPHLHPLYRNGTVTEKERFGHKIASNSIMAISPLYSLSLGEVSIHDLITLMLPHVTI